MSDYFAFFNIPRVYNVDIAELESAYLKLQAKYHPDRYIRSGAEERVAALNKSIEINQAYKTLKNPLSRAEYMLGLTGINITEYEKATPELLMEMMELGEELEQADGVEAKAELLIKINLQLKLVLQEFAKYYESGKYIEATHHYQKAKFLQRFITNYISTDHGLI